MALQADNIADLVTTTLRELGPPKWTDISTDLQEYVAMPKMLKKEKVQFDNGIGIQRNVMIDITDGARNVGLMETDIVDIGDVMKTINIPWRHTVASTGYDRRELTMNKEPARIVELIKTRRADMMISLAERMETDFWSKPADSTDEITPFGIKYWICMGSTNEGFNGGDPSGFTSGAGNLTVATAPRWQNYTAGYSAVTKADLVAKWRKAATFTNFKAPVDIPQYASSARYSYYTNYAVISALETLLENQNDNLGNDVASKDGLTIFRRVPVQWAPKLEGTSQNPIYGIDWNSFYPVFMKGEYMKEETLRNPTQHTVYNTFVDTSYNYLCTNRRKNFVLATATF